MEMIPESGTSVLLDNHPIDILQIKENMVKTVRIHKPLQDNTESAIEEHTS
jgi:Mg2+/Co2+ transporter CorB